MGLLTGGVSDKVAKAMAANAAAKAEGSPLITSTGSSTIQPASAGQYISPISGQQAVKLSQQTGQVFNTASQVNQYLGTNYGGDYRYDASIGGIANAQTGKPVSGALPAPTNVATAPNLQPTPNPTYSPPKWQQPPVPSGGSGSTAIPQTPPGQTASSGAAPVPTVQTTTATHNAPGSGYVPGTYNPASGGGTQAESGQSAPGSATSSQTTTAAPGISGGGQSLGDGTSPPTYEAATINEAGTYDPATLGKAGQYIPPEVIAASYDPYTQQVSQEDLSAWHLNNLMNEDGTYLQTARRQGERAAAARGLLNTSMAAGAAQRAAIEAAAPFALQDSQTFNNRALQNMSYINQARKDNAYMTQAARLANAGFQENASQFGIGQMREDVNAQNQAGQFNAASRNDVSQFNAASMNQAGQFNVGTAKDWYMQQAGFKQDITMAGLNKDNQIELQEAIGKIDLTKIDAQGQWSLKQSIQDLANDLKMLETSSDYEKLRDERLHEFGLEVEDIKHEYSVEDREDTQIWQSGERLASQEHQSFLTTLQGQIESGQIDQKAKNDLTYLGQQTNEQIKLIQEQLRTDLSKLDRGEMWEERKIGLEAEAQIKIEGVLQQGREKLADMGFEFEAAESEKNRDHDLTIQTNDQIFKKLLQDDEQTFAFDFEGLTHTNKMALQTMIGNQNIEGIDAQGQWEIKTIGSQVAGRISEIQAGLTADLTKLREQGLSAERLAQKESELRTNSEIAIYNVTHAGQKELQLLQQEWQSIENFDQREWEAELKKDMADWDAELRNSLQDKINNAALDQIDARGTWDKSIVLEQGVQRINEIKAEADAAIAKLGAEDSSFIMRNAITTRSTNEINGVLNGLEMTRDTHQGAIQQSIQDDAQAHDLTIQSNDQEFTRSQTIRSENYGLAIEALKTKQWAFGTFIEGYNSRVESWNDKIFDIKAGYGAYGSLEIDEREIEAIKAGISANQDISAYISQFLSVELPKLKPPEDAAASSSSSSSSDSGTDSDSSSDPDFTDGTAPIFDASDLTLDEAETQVADIYESVFDYRPGDAAGISYWAGELSKGNLSFTTTDGKKLTGVEALREILKSNKAADRQAYNNDISTVKSWYKNILQLTPDDPSDDVTADAINEGAKWWVDHSIENGVPISSLYDKWKGQWDADHD